MGVIGELGIVLALEVKVVLVFGVGLVNLVQHALKELLPVPVLEWLLGHDEFDVYQSQSSRGLGKKQE